MKNLLLLPLKKKLMIGGAVVVLAAGGVTAALNQPSSAGADDSPLVQQVQHNTDELANHDARITNTENDVKDLQDKTGTPPSTTRVYVPVVSSSSQPVDQGSTSSGGTTQPAPQQTPVTVASSSINFGGQYDGYCTLTYTDGSRAYVQATMTTTQNGNSQSAQDNCQSFVGQAKS